MMKRTTSKLAITSLVLAMGVILSAGQAMGAFLIEYQDGTVGNPFTGWAGAGLGGERDIVAGDGSAEATIDPDDEGAGVGTTFHTDSALVVDPSDQGEFEFESDYFFTTALSSDLSEMAGIRFDFYAETAAPTRMGAYFYDADATDYWFYELDSYEITVDAWTTYDFAFTSSRWTAYPDLSYVGGVAGAPGAGVLDNVTQIGFMVTYLDDNTTQAYGVDDFGLTVPEPETYLVLGMALLSIAIVFRKRISDSICEARQMMQA